RTTTLAPGELIEAVVIPEPRPSTYLWQRVRRVNDISQVGVAAAWSPSSARWSVAVGGAWPTPSRLARVEAILSTAEPSSQVIEAAAVAAADAAPFQTDKRASEAYRRQVLRVLVRRAVDRILSGGRP
ncbi:MAG TPA: hypothetical protein VLX64_03125, partial [Thermoplasmata archaeon]|nr:hypothetical protein [Thermoplasmata archaeon]